MADDWRKINRGLFESPDGQWRISNPGSSRPNCATAGSSPSAAATEPAGTCTTGPRHPARRPRLLARCHGTTARRVAERINPILLLLGDLRHGRGRILGRLLPPTTHTDDLHDVEYRLRELTP